MRRTERLARHVLAGMLWRLAGLPLRLLRVQRADGNLGGPGESVVLHTAHGYNFMLNHFCSIDDNNYYVEEFDTLDGAHWEIAVDMDGQLLDMLDEETKGAEYE